jgi:hypothetical protein
MKTNKVGGACSTYGGEDSCVQGFGGETLGEGDHLKDPGVDGRIIDRSSGSGMWGHGLD